MFSAARLRGCRALQDAGLSDAVEPQILNTVIGVVTIDRPTVLVVEGGNVDPAFAARSLRLVETLETG